MNGGTRTAPSGAVVPAAIRTAPTCAPPGEGDAMIESRGRHAAYDILNVLTVQGDTIRELREALRVTLAELRAKSDEVEALKRHIEQMSVLA